MMRKILNCWMKYEQKSNRLKVFIIVLPFNHINIKNAFLDILSQFNYNN